MSEAKKLVEADLDTPAAIMRQSYSEKENEHALSLLSFGVEVNYPVYGLRSVADFFQSFLQLLRLRIVQHESEIGNTRLLLISLIPLTEDDFQN